MFDQHFDDLHHQMQRFIEYMSQKPAHLGEFARETWQPNVDVYESPNTVIVIVELAGLKPESLDIAVQGRNLLLRGTRVPRLHAKDLRVSNLEIAYGPFERLVHLPNTVDGNKAEAHYTDGLLEIVLPVATPFRPEIRTVPTSRAEDGA